MLLYAWLLKCLYLQSRLRSVVHHEGSALAIMESHQLRWHLPHTLAGFIVVPASQHTSRHQVSSRCNKQPARDPATHQYGMPSSVAYSVHTSAAGVETSAVAASLSAVVARAPSMDARPIARTLACSPGRSQRLSPLRAL